jgi:hypothetical protein
MSRERFHLPVDFLVGDGAGETDMRSEKVIQKQVPAQCARPVASQEEDRLHL